MDSRGRQTRRRGLAGGVVLVACSLLGGCLSGPDLSGVASEASRPVRRYDTVQMVSAGVGAVIAGTQSGALLVSTDAGRSWRREGLGQASLVGATQCPDGRFLALDFYRKLWVIEADGRGARAVGFDKPRVPLTLACDVKGGWWVAGTHSQIAHSADGGATWTLTDLGEDAQITSLQFLEAGLGIATGEFGLIAKSGDGGATWSLQPPMPGEFYPYATLFRDRNEGWASGLAGQILHTRDGGASWQRQGNASAAPLYRLFLHEGRPYGVGAGGTVARLDGDAWQAVPYPDPLPVFFAAGASLPGQNALVAGGPGGLLRVIGAQAN